jgi:hypothetical protein
METLAKYQNKNIDLGALIIENFECYEGLEVFNNLMGFNKKWTTILQKLKLMERHKENK